MQRRRGRRALATGERGQGKGRERGSKENVQRRKGLSRSNWPWRLKESSFVLSRKRQKGKLLLRPRWMHVQRRKMAVHLQLQHRIKSKKTFTFPPTLSGIQGILTSLTRRRPTFQLLGALLPLLV